MTLPPAPRLLDEVTPGATKKEALQPLNDLQEQVCWIPTPRRAL